MRTYNTHHAYYCGVDLHARSLYLHILDDAGRTRLEQNLPARPGPFLDAIAPYRDGLVVGCECMFAWYWLADLCERERIPFVLGHARSALIFRPKAGLRPEDRKPRALMSTT